MIEDSEAKNLVQNIPNRTNRIKHGSRQSSSSTIGTVGGIRFSVLETYFKIMNFSFKSFYGHFIKKEKGIFLFKIKADNRRVFA